MNRDTASMTFEKLFSDYKGKFIRFAQNYVRNSYIAEDFVIDAFVDYWQRKDTLGDEDNIPAYILTAVKHKCLNYLKRQQLETAVSDNMQTHQQWELNTRIATLEACEPYELFSSEIQELVRKALEKMPERTVQIFEMSRNQNKSHQEIADQLGVTTKAVEFHITKTLKLLRVALRDYMHVVVWMYSLFS